MRDRIPVQSTNPWIQLVSTLGITGIIVAGLIYFTEQVVEKGPSWIVAWSTISEQIEKTKADALKAKTEAEAKSMTPDQVREQMRRYEESKTR